MPALVYIHGFLSSPLSLKAQQVKTWLKQNRTDIDYYCPNLTPYPGEVKEHLESLVESLLPAPVWLIGSSMGGFWATYLAERYDLPAVLINPAVRPHEHMPQYLGIELKNFYSEDVYRLEHVHMDELKAADTESILHKQNYWLMVQTGDETLDYRAAVAKYQGCKQLVEEGGDHSFQQFEKWIAKIIHFFEKQV